MSERKNININPDQDKKIEVPDPNIAAPSDVSSVAGSVKHLKHATSSERQIKFERAQKCLENAALVSKRIKEHRKATAELLGRPFEEDVGDTASEVATTISERTGYSAATDTSATLSVQDALNIPGISESLANTLKQKELLMERIKQYKEISKRPMKKPVQIARKDSVNETLDLRKSSENPDISKLVNTIKEKDNNLSVMQVKMRAMETTILDLQEKNNEKDQIIEAKNRATTLISDSLSKKEKETLSKLEDTKEQMIKMQNNFINMETEWKEEKQKLINEIEEKNDKINSLKEANTILENARFEITMAHSKLADELELKTKEVLELQEKINKLSDHSINPLIADKDQEEEEEEKGSIEVNNMEELSKKIELLEQINFEIRQTNKELENQLATINQEPKSSVSPNKRGSPLPSRKTGRGSKMKSPWSNLSSESLQETDKKVKTDKNKSDMVQALNKEILQKEYLIAQKDMLITKLQSNIDKKEAIISELELSIKNQKQLVETSDIATSAKLEPPTIDKQDIECQNIEELQDKLNTAQAQIITLNDEIEAANKNMIKVKSNFKLKMKQMQKTIDNFSKVSDANAEIIKLNEEIQQLTQKVAELEEEKGNLQLHLVDYDSGRLTESDIYKKLVEMENLSEARLKSITLLETQKFDLVQELHSVQQKNLEMEDKLADISLLQNEQVCSEMKSVQLEEQIDKLQASKNELELIIENLNLDKEQLSGAIKLHQEEKEELIQKLDNYIQENIELTDKLEKLSAEKVSSAESIEIVESLTTQEKLELEEYNKSLQSDNKIEGSQTELTSQGEEPEKQNEKLIEEAIQLKKKIELFSCERQEVMEKMNKLSLENESLNENIRELAEQCNNLKNTIDLLNDEKIKLISVNEDLNHQIDELKQEKSEILKETAEAIKPLNTEDVTDGSTTDSIHHDDKSADKSANRTKSVKQLTKEILKLKNTIKEREDEIADCQMKILSLEEQQDKQKEILQKNASNEKLIKKLTDENNQLKNHIDTITNENRAEQNLHISQAELIQVEIQKVHQEYTTAISARDNRIHELENVLVEYEKQVINYSNTLQQKDKELSEYINQITKLNDVTQKLKSTVDLLEEEKAKDQNGELIKSLNKQIALYQKTLSDYEEKLRVLEEEKAQLMTIKSKQENKNNGLEAELKKLQELFTEKQDLLTELQNQQQKQHDERSALLQEAKERDEEIHEIKLQLRKESIDNEKLHNIVVQKSSEFNELTKLFEDAKEKLNTVSDNKNVHDEQYIALENKNKELMEKLKKYAINFKKKANMYSELENLYNEVQKQLDNKNEQYDQLLIQVDTIPALQEKLKHAEEEFNRLQSQKIIIEQKSQEILHLQSQIETLKKQVINDNQKNIQLNESIDLLNKDLYLARDQNKNLENQTETLNKKIVEYEIEQRNNANILTKISCLEAEVNQKQEQMSELSNQLEIQKEKLMQVQFGHDAKVQESDMYIESLQSEIDKYKNRIYRLEESISTMENRRQSLERKADSLDIQLHEKQKAYDEYNHQEDELVNRLAVLIDNDRVVEKQITEIESENKELRFKLQNVNDEIQNLQRSYFDLQTKCDILEDKAKKADSADSEIIMYQNTIRELEANLKRVTNEHSTLFAQKKAVIEELELEFNTQIESAIKEKKILSEKYEKICDHTSQLEMKLNEYRNTIETLNLNLSDLGAQNQALINKANIAQKEVTPDYTEQYISEINKLNSVLNSKNTEITDLNDKIQKLQQSNLSNMSNLESKNSDLINKVDSTSIIINNLTAELQTLKQNNEQLQILMNQKDEQIKQIVENKKLNFEMNIPKTEGMTISSTIEAVDLEPKPFDISYLQSQIISDTDFPTTESQEQHISKKISEIEVKQPLQTITPSGVIEETIVPKKSYVCYKQDVESEEVDPFNSDEGWGLEAGEESEEVTPGFAHLNQQIEQLNETNQKLKLELDTTNAKLLKALKKLKELKATNDMLSKELQLTKTISQSSMLDMAIESELSSNLEALEKKIQELNTDLSKEKREKEYLKKQNEVFKNANDRLTEMKEKMDSELQMWKYNFKQVNDKVSSLQWGGESNDTVDASRSQHAPVECSRVSTSRVEEDMKKLEKENDELQTTVENLNEQNIQLSKEVEQLKIELSNLKQELHQRQESCNNCKNVKELHQKLLEEKENLQLENNNLKVELKQEKLCLKCESLKQKIDELVTKISSLEECNKEISENTNQLEDRHKQLINENENLQFKIQENQTLYKLSEENLQLKNNELLAEIDSFKISENEANLKIVSLSNELQETVKIFAEKEKAETANNVNAIAIAEKYQNIEEISLNLKNSIDEANLKIYELEEQNKIITESNSQYEKQIFDLNEKLRNLNTENDQLLSTVTELRSSVSSAMDQRGFEIAELWKQHLAQRECEFQQIEQDLRSQMNASEAKYEQLLEKVQSSDQAETNKIILAEQISSLQNKLQEKEEHLTSLRDKYTEVINQLDLLRSEMEDEKLIHENKILVHQEEYEKVIQELNKNNREQCDELESAMKNLQTELEATKTVNTTLNLEADDLRNNYENKISELIKQLQIKDSEIFQKTHDYTISLTQGNEEFENVRKQLIEYEKKVEDLTFEKESELAILRLKMHEQTESFDKKQKEVENEKNNVSESLKEKIIECTNLNKQIVDLNKVLEEYANRATETQEVLENQELEIVTLKDEVASLKDSLRAASSKIEKHVTFASGTKLGPDGETTSVGLDKELLDAVPRAELDLALYMLHQRDVRCEELTMELTQLLEERDTLQLRLSDSLRSFEELKSRCSSAGFDLSINASHEGTAELPSFTIEKEHQFVDTHKPHTSRSSSVSDPDADKPKLQAKLSELRTVRHSRDVVLRHESEQRQLGMRLLQRDVANLPPEAVEQLTQAHHTLSRDTQSTPTVLLNWLRGKSTPKVVHM